MVAFVLYALVVFYYFFFCFIFQVECSCRHLAKKIMGSPNRGDANLHTHAPCLILKCYSTTTSFCCCFFHFFLVILNKVESAVKNVQIYFLQQRMSGVLYSVYQIGITFFTTRKKSTKLRYHDTLKIFTKFDEPRVHMNEIDCSWAYLIF